MNVFVLYVVEVFDHYIFSLCFGVCIPMYVGGCIYD